MYGTPTSYAALTLNVMTAFAGGIMAASLLARDDLGAILSGGIAGLVAASAAADLYHPLQALIVAAAGDGIAHWASKRVHTAVARHGVAGGFGLLAAGAMLWGYPATRAV
ncbi:MAG: ammonium transporter, partial [Alphaproteobacteria bacterium]|nr:ammonium transporter [Alphaproteobacteria bacterium]